MNEREAVKVLIELRIPQASPTHAVDNSCSDTGVVGSPRAADDQTIAAWISPDRTTRTEGTPRVLDGVIETGI
jgi:hypothetical protein